MNWRIVLPLLALSLPLLADDAVAPAQKAEHFEKQVSLTYKYDYLLYLPPGYEEGADKKWPLVIFLHGSGESGSDLNSVKRHGLAEVLEKRHDLPFICISPQAPGKGWDVATLNALLDDAIKRYHVDEDRVILTGLSMGGFGTWDWAGSNPERFAAVVPVCGGGSPIRATPLGARKIPVWAFHGAEDHTVPVAWQQMLVDLVNQRGGQAKFTVYPGVGHDSWVKAYDEPDLYTWMMAQKRHLPPEPQPVK